MRPPRSEPMIHSRVRIICVWAVTLICAVTEAGDTGIVVAEQGEQVLLLRGLHEEVEKSSHRESGDVKTGHHAEHGEGHISKVEHHGGEEGHEEGHEGGHEEHGEEDEEVNPVTVTTSFLLMLFIAFDMCLLYLVNYNDANIRSYSYKMISTTISIFCAVLFNQALFAFIFKQLLASPWHTETGIPRGLGIEVKPWHKLVVGLVVFSLAWTMLNWMCWKHRRNESTVYAARSLGGHISAWAAIITFRNCMSLFLPEKAETEDAAEAEAAHTGVCWSLVGVWSVAALFMVFASWCSMSVRRKYTGLRHGVSRRGSVSPMTPEQEDRNREKKYWRVSICEGEDDATALVLSFVVLQVSIYWITGALPPLGSIGGTHPLAQELSLLWLTGLFFVVLLALTFIIIFKEEEIEKSYIAERLMSGSQSFMAMCMAWSLLRMGDWHMRKWMTQKEMAQVVNASVMSAFSVICIIFLDKIADAYAPERQTRQEYTRIMTDYQENTNTTSRNSKDTSTEPGDSTTLTALVDSPGRRGSLLNPNVPELPSMHERLSALILARPNEMLDVNDMFEKLTDNTSLEKALRTIIDGFGLLVGLAWDKAFDAADEAIVEGTHGLHEHVVIAKMAIAALLVLFVIPAWKWYIVPKACMHWTVHEEIIQRESISTKDVPDEETDAPGMSPETPVGSKVSKPLMGR